MFYRLNRTSSYVQIDAFDDSSSVVFVKSFPRYTTNIGTSYGGNIEIANANERILIPFNAIKFEQSVPSLPQPDEVFEAIELLSQDYFGAV